MHFQQGKINALIGPNGSGKTTFFNCVTGMIKPDSGTVTYRAGTSPGGPAPDRRAGIGRSFQLCRIFPRMTVLENMLVAVRRRRLCTGCAGSRTPPRSSGRGAAARVGIDHLEHSEARDISYGQQKLLELAGCSWATPRRSCSTSRPAA